MTIGGVESYVKLLTCLEMESYRKSGGARSAAQLERSPHMGWVDEAG
jgi:hypothetical protein